MITLEAGEPETPNTPPQYSFWKALPDNTVGKAVIPSKLPSGICTYATSQIVFVAAPSIPPAALARARAAIVSNWKESGVVAEFCCHWIRQ